MKNYSTITMFLGLVILLVGCNSSNEDVPLTISNSSNSTYSKTFEELHLGEIFDYNATWEKADRTWVSLWAEGYENGEKIEDHLAGFGYGESPDDGIVEGNLGFGIIQLNDTAPFLLTYGHNSSGRGQLSGMEIYSEGNLWTWDNAVPDDELQLRINETKILAVYRETSSNGIRTGYDYQNEEEIQRVIDSYEKVILLKVRVSEQPDF